MDVEFHINLQSQFTQRDDIFYENSTIYEGLTPKTTYVFQIYASYSNKQTKLASIQFTTLPSGPKVFTREIRSRSAEIGWELEDDEESVEDYSVMFCKDEEGTRPRFTSHISEIIGHLEPDNEYCVKVAAVLSRSTENKLMKTNIEIEKHGLYESSGSEDILRVQASNRSYHYFCLTSLLS